MRIAYTGNKRYLHWPKVVALLTLLVIGHETCAQTSGWIKRRADYDSKKLSYGFLIGLHTTAYKIKYSETFLDQTMDSVHSVNPGWLPGFSLGFIVNYRLEDLWDVRITPKVAFYEHELNYQFLTEPYSTTHRVETTMVEFPLLVKFKSERRENVRMYMIGGAKAAIEASGKKEIENVTSELEITGGNLSAEFGFGFDIYYPLFKFSPEIRFSKGLVDILDNHANPYGVNLERVSTNTVTVYLLFQ